MPKPPNEAVAAMRGDSMPKSILITGASGFLGRALVRRATGRDDVDTIFAGHCRNPESVPTCAGVERIELDLMGLPAQLESRIRACAPRTIIHAAAANPGSPTETMKEINTTGTARIAKTATFLEARFVMVSTDVVHDGRNAPYLDSDPPTAQDPYGASKGEAEHVAQLGCPEAAIVRPSLIYGVDRSEGADRSTLAFAKRLSAGEFVRLFSDVIRQPIWVENLAEALLQLALDETEFSGILNAVGDQALSRDAFGRRMLDWFEVPGREQVQTIRAAELEHPPPLDLRMNNQALKDTLGIALPGVDEVLMMERNRLEKT